MQLLLKEQLFNLVFRSFFADISNVFKSNQIIEKNDLDESVLDNDLTEEDKSDLGFYIRNGIVVVVKNATIANGTII